MVQQDRKITIQQSIDPVEEIWAKKWATTKNGIEEKLSEMGIDVRFNATFYDDNWWFGVAKEDASNMKRTRAQQNDQTRRWLEKSL